MSEQIVDAQALEAEGKLAEAVQVYAEVLETTDATPARAGANFGLGRIYQTWREFFTAHRFFAAAHELAPEDTEIRAAVAELNQHFSENRETIAAEMSRKNSDQIVSLFRIATGIKLITMGKPVQAYPLLKSRTKIFPNAAVAKHLLTDIQITESERNSAIDFLLERAWLLKTGESLYTIATPGLFTFYVELAGLHVANADPAAAAACYEQAYWLDPSQHQLPYQQVICYATGAAWEPVVAILETLPSEEVPAGVDPVAFYRSAAQAYHRLYEATQADSAKQKVIEACEAVLRINGKDRQISKLLAGYRGKKRLWPW